MIPAWLPVPGLEGVFLVSSDGRVLSVATGKVLCQYVGENGYAIIALWNPSTKKKKTFRVHRLVASVFIRPPVGDEQVNHIDCDKLNNDVGNLEWCTASENTVHAAKNGRLKNRTFSDDDISVIKAKAMQGALLREIADEYGVTATCIGLILNGRTYQGIGLVPPRYRKGAGRPRRSSREANYAS